MDGIIFRVAALLLMLVGTANALDNGLALTPPMGFNSWSQFRCNIDCANDPDNCISEKLYTDIADRMVADGYLDVGYKYVNMDDCWLSPERDSDGKLTADPDRFPNGIAYLADYMHQRGLLFGIYEDVGSNTCAGYPGSSGHYEVDAQTFADWGVDYLKFDGCNEPLADFAIDYITMGKALSATGRPIVYSTEWALYQDQSGYDPDYDAIEENCNLCRNYQDVQPSYDSLKSIMQYFAFDQVELIPHAGPGYWNDPDMLVIGESGVTFDQSRVQMAIWSILAAPLLISADLRTIDPDMRDILLNKDAIAVDQDALGIQGSRIYQVDTKEVWARPVNPTVDEFYSYAVAFLNNGATEQSFSAELSQLGLNYSGGYKVKDIFNGTDFGVLQSSDVITVTVNPTGVVFLKATLNV